MPTPHISANPGDFAPTVLMPGDPLRARHLAHTFLDSPRQVNAVRHMLAYTGTHAGQPVSVMGSGMGIPSISIYAEELFTQFGVERIIRIGSCGAVSPDLQLRDLVIGMGASTDSAVNRARFGGHDFAALASPSLLENVMQTAREQNTPVHIGNLFSTDLFYHPKNETLLTMLQSMGILAIEMEAAGLYGCAAACGKQALTICTVSDLIRQGERLSAEEREQGFDAMIQLALQSLPPQAS